MSLLCWGRGNHKGNLHIQSKLRMLSRIPGGNSGAILHWLFLTVLIAQLPLKAPPWTTLPQQCPLTGTPQQLCHPGLGLPARLCCVPPYSSPLCSLQALLFQAEWDAAEVRLVITRHSAVHASPRAVPTACSSQHTHICFSGQENETAELSHGELSTTGEKCCCLPRYVEA